MMRIQLSILLIISAVILSAGENSAYARKVEKVSERFEKLKAAGDSTRSNAERKGYANAVYPLVYSTKKRMTGILSDWEDIKYTGEISCQSDEEGIAVPKDLKAYFKATISDDILYILAIAKDSQIVFARHGHAYHNDCFEFFLDPFFTRREQTDDSNAQIFITAEDQAGKKFYSQGKIPVRVIRVEVDGGWGVEIAVPLNNDYFKAQIFDGLAMGFNICYNNNDNGKRRQHKLSWSALDRNDTSWQNPAVYGVLEVVCPMERPIAPIAPVAPGPGIMENQLRRNAGETVWDFNKLAKYQPSPPVVRGFQVGNFNEETAREIVRWGANAVRIQIAPYQYVKRKGLDWQNGKDQFMKMLAVKLKDARNNSLKVIIDMHSPPVNGGNIWNNPDLEKNFTTIWRDIAEYLEPYRDTIWGYDLFNEPLERTQLPYAPLEWRPLAVKIIKAIREVDPDTWIIYESGPGGGWRGFEDLKPLPDYKVIYSFHFYQPGAFTHQGIAASQLQDAALLAQAQEATGIKYPGVIGNIEWNRARIEKQLQPVIDFQKRYRVPIFIGEFSVIAWAPVESAVQYLKDVTGIFEKYGWSWTYHAFREYQGWSLEHEDGVVKPAAKLQKVNNSARANVIKEALKNNLKK